MTEINNKEKFRFNYKGDFSKPDILVQSSEFNTDLELAEHIYEKLKADHTTKEDPFGEFKFGDRIQFVTGLNNDILMESVVFGFCNVDTPDYFKKGMIYVYTDAYWFPIQRKVFKK